MRSAEDTPSNPPLVYFIHADHIDTPRIVVDRSNNLRWRWMAEPFGTTAPETNPVSLGVFTQNLRFPGQYADQESGLSYNYFRDYDGSKGGYVQSDPIGLDGGINTYAYVAGQPTRFADPAGLWSTAAYNYTLWLSLSGLTADELRNVQAGSAWVDRIDNQFGDGSPQHAMRNFGQSVGNARNQACQFIRSHLAIYERFKNSPVAKLRTSAYRSLGAALHPVMDSTSPEHAGWDPRVRYSSTAIFLLKTPSISRRLFLQKPSGASKPCCAVTRVHAFCRKGSEHGERLSLELRSVRCRGHRICHRRGSSDKQPRR